MIKMENKGKIGVGILTIALLISLGFNVQPEDTHFCLDRNITYHCDSLSKYYGLDNGKCINNVLPNKLCSSGWIKIGSGDVQESKQYGNKVICDQNKCRTIQ